MDYGLTARDTFEQLKKCPARSIQAHYEQLPEFERGRIIELKEGGENRRIAGHIGRSWNHADWGRIIFREELSFQLCPDKHRRRVWGRPGQRAKPVFTIAGHTGPQQRVMYHGFIFQQDNAKPYTTRVTRNCLTAYQTLPWPARSLSNRACLRYDGKTTASIREC
ncbi:hypothetical protein TNCV_3625541 [Trichonephila clavipes]|nr:hypothetical protein TNCV_3625541 [Trichonephila clavipes]